MRLLKEELIMMTAGLLIKEIMYKSDMNQSEIAKKVKCSQVTISRLRNNRCEPEFKTLKNLIALAAKYKINVTLDDF